jgi:hypothetical protein
VLLRFLDRLQGSEKWGTGRVGASASERASERERGGKEIEGGEIVLMSAAANPGAS